MRKKGFTLIELLAVIVILAIIAVITVPKVSEMIDSSRKGSAEDSFYGIIKTAELAFSKGLKDNKNLGSSTCEIENQELKCTGNVGNNTVTFSSVLTGRVPEDGLVVLNENGFAFVKASNSLLINGYNCYGNSSKVICSKDSIVLIGDQKVKTVTTNSGLYASDYELGRYIYRGTSPDNYIKLGNDMYRIVSKEADGTLKVIKSESIGNMVFDLGYETNIAGVINSNSIEGTRYSNNSSDFCYANSEEKYSGCKEWENSSTMLE